MSELDKFFLYGILIAILIIPIISFLFILFFSNEFNPKEALAPSITLDFVLLALLNTAALFLFDFKHFISSIIIYILLFFGIHHWDKYAKRKGYN